MFTRFSRNSSLFSMEFFINDDIIDAYSKLQNQQYPFIFKAQGADFVNRSKWRLLSSCHGDSFASRSV